VEGALSCSGCGVAYPVRAGIPRFATESVAATDDPARKLSVRTSRCYTHLWQRKEQSMGWKYKPEGEFEYFLSRMGASRDKLPGRSLLDAGCGDGRLTSALTALGLETVGIDLSEGVDIGYTNNRSPLVHYVQGDLLCPPFRTSSFDLVWSSGVLHHTRDTRLAFEECIALVRPGGRLYVWLYDKEPEGRRALIRLLQKAPMVLKRTGSRLMALGNRTKRLVYAGNPVTSEQSFDEVYFWNLDMYGPEFRHLQSELDVRGWYDQRGFTNVVRRDRSVFGFGLTGDCPP
jgi:SAM-dependent methyltransferase